MSKYYGALDPPRATIKTDMPCVGCINISWWGWQLGEKHLRRLVGWGVVMVVVMRYCGFKFCGAYGTF